MSTGNTSLGRVVGDGAEAHWSGTGRRLTDWEHRMRASMTDVWVPAFGGVYRLFLPMAQAIELENICGVTLPDGRRPGKSMMVVASGIPADGEVTASKTTTRTECLHVVRLALIGGGIAIVAGQRQTVTAKDAGELVATHLADAPITEIWRLARAVLDAAINGRPATPEEIKDFTIPRGPPIIPAWAINAVLSQGMTA